MDKTRTIGRYQIQAQIGRGGFGTVYRAWDPTVGREVAIKILTANRDKDLVTRFRNEAAAAGNLHHRNIVTIHDFDEYNGVPYIVMQLLDGVTLAQAIAEKLPWSLLQKMNVMMQVAAGLLHAHRHGIVHRDVKPSNIMVLPDQSVRILDFGIARLSSETSREMNPGILIGSVLYMAPELFSGAAVDSLTDIWAYGVTFYELVAGRHPFTGGEQNLQEVAFEIMRKDPPVLRSVAPQCPEALQQIVMRLLEKNRELRYQSLEDVQLDLQPIVVELQKDRAQAMIATVHQLVDTGRLEEAQAATREVLQLDPGNPEARSLFQRVRTDKERLLIQSRIQSLLEAADRAMQTREFDEAISSLQIAWKLSGGDPVIDARLREAQSLQSHSRQAQSLLKEAHRMTTSQDLDGAFHAASEAALADPTNPSASHLIAQLKQEMQAREQRQIDEAIIRVRHLLMHNDPGQASAFLNELSSRFPHDARIAELVESMQQNVVQQQRARQEERIRAARAEAERLLDRGCFEEAIGLLAQILGEYPGDPSVSEVLARARHLGDERRRRDAVASLASQITAAMGAGELSGALPLLDRARREFPGEPEFDKLASTVARELDMKQARARQQIEHGEQDTAVEHHAAQKAEPEQRGFPSQPAGSQEAQGNEPARQVHEPVPKPAAERRHGSEIIDLEAIRRHLKKWLPR